MIFLVALNVCPRKGDCKLNKILSAASCCPEPSATQINPGYRTHGIDIHGENIYKLE